MTPAQIDAIAALREAREELASIHAHGFPDGAVVRVAEAVADRDRAEAERDTALAHVAELEAEVQRMREGIRGKLLDVPEEDKDIVGILLVQNAMVTAERDTALSSLADAQTRAAAQQETIDGLRAAGEEARAFVREFVFDVTRDQFGRIPEAVADRLETRARVLMSEPPIREEGGK